jgi:hypothetical protein
MTAKRQLSDQVLGGIKERNACFSRETIQAAADKAGLTAREAEINGLVHLTPMEIALMEEAGSGSLRP